MESRARSESRFHALLIGIDGYASAPLAGCVNDIDAVQRVLMGPGLRVPRDRITRLASPGAGAPKAAPSERPATLDNIRRALETLGSAEVASGDRVFIYYSGHGTRVQVAGASGQRFHREAIVPVDFVAVPGPPRLLFDFELNQLLRAIVARTTSVSVVLDCCQAAGTWRSAGDELKPRFVDPSRHAALIGPLPDPASAGGATEAHATGLARSADLEHARARLASVDACHVVAACQSHELAYEARGEGDTLHGLFTQAFLHAVHAATSDDLATLTWGRIWQSLRATQARRNDRQTPAMHGDLARLVFGGPPVEGDAGFQVSRSDDGYLVDAGTLADLTEDTGLAVYGERPLYFPAMGSREDRDTRLGLLTVTSATLSTAAAKAQGAPLDLPPGARARIVRAGKSARLGYAIEPPNDRLASLLAASPLLEPIAGPAEPDVKLVRSDGKWFLTDAIHGVRGDQPVLFALHSAELDCARAVLEHYCAYVRPLRMAARAGDLRGELVLDVLSCPAGGQLSPAEAQDANLPEAPSRAAGTYELRSGDQICLRVQNQSRHRLHVTLVNSAASGRVQLLGEATIEARSTHIFWAHSALGSPFHMVPPPNVACCADRMVAIGTTANDHDLRYLRVDRSFAQVIQKTRDAEVPKDLDAGIAPAPIIHWTSAHVVIETRARQTP